VVGFRSGAGVNGNAMAGGGAGGCGGSSTTAGCAGASAAGGSARISATSGSGTSTGGAPAQWVGGNSTAGAAVGVAVGLGAAVFAGGAATGFRGGIAAGGFVGVCEEVLAAGLGAFAADRFVPGGAGTTMILPQAPQRILRPDNCESTSKTWPEGQIKRRIIASSRMGQNPASSRKSLPWRTTPHSTPANYSSA
jgi:hypothetical protein